MKRLLFSVMWFPVMTSLLMAAGDESQPASALDPLNGPPPFTVNPELVNVPVEEIERAFAGRTPPEAMRMFLSIQRGSRMGPGEGWFGPAQSRYSFAWLAERHGVTPADGIEADKFQGEPEWFARLDRNRDGKITGDDLDWSDRNSWVQHAYVANRLFRRMDPNGDGKLAREEWLAFFDAVAQGRDEVNSEEMREAWLAGLSSGFLPGDAPTPDLLLKGLFAGEVGSLQEGPSVNELAPDFVLKTHDGSRTVRLSEVIGSKPVVLVFGNFTCGPFRSMYPGVEDVYRRFKDAAVFLGVYVREAHPTDGWKMESNAKVGVAVAQPKTTAERIDVAQQCHRLLKPSIPLLVDEIDDPTGNAYSGMPARLYVIDTAGKIAFKSGRGPFGFKTGEMEQALMMTLVDATSPKPEATQGKRDTAPVFHERPRVELATNDEAWRLLPEATVGRGQPLPNWAKALAPKLPHTTAAMLELDHLYRTTPQFSGRERGLVRLSAARINRSGYGLALARAELKEAALTDAQLEQLSAGELGSLEERERLIVRFAEQLSRAGRDLTDAQVDEVKRAFGEDRLVGLVLLTAYANFQDRLVHALALPIETDGPLPPLDVKFANSTPGGSLTPPATRPALPTTSAADDVRIPQWSDFSFEALQARLEQQRDRAPRVAIPEWDEVIERLPKGLYNPDKPLRIRWSRLVIGRQPQLGPAWVKCLRVFGNEAKQDRAFEESVFWVVTRELRCFYCMGHCEMLMQVGGLSGEQVVDRTRQMAEGNWSGFAPGERATFSLASQMTSAPWTVSAQDVERVEQALGPERALDAIWWISRCQFMTKVSDTFQLQLERDNVFQNFEPPREEAKK